MARSVLELARQDIVQLQPYQHAAWDPAFERMHAKEMPWRAQGDNTLSGLNRYPEPQPRALVERMALLYGAPLFLGLAFAAGVMCTFLMDGVFARNPRA